MGDVELTRKNGLLLLKDGMKAVKHSSPLHLATYAIDQGAINLHLFENDEWQVVELFNVELMASA